MLKRTTELEKDGQKPSHIGIGHTRWATHGEPSETNSHPHNSMSGKISVVHNGIIENYLELKAELKEKGVVFKSETDTEVVAHLYEELYDGDMISTTRKLLTKIRGAYALGIMCSEHPDTLVAVRKGSPLLVGLGKGENYIASDIPALLEYTRDYYLLDEYEIAELKNDGVTLFDAEGNIIEKEIYHVTWDFAAAEKGGYDYFMMKEIMEQPEVLAKTIQPRLTETGIKLDEISLTEEEIRNCGRIHIVACGTAMHAGIVGRYVMEEIARIPVEVDIASEFRYRNPILNKGELCIIISQSGETADTKAALEEAKRQGLKVISIVNVVGSSIARESDDVIYTWAGPEIAVASTKGYTTQVSVLYLIALHFAKVRGTMTEEAYLAAVKELHELPARAEEVLKVDERMAEIAKKYADRENAFIIGRGLDYAVPISTLNPMQRAN